MTTHNADIDSAFVTSSGTFAGQSVLEIDFAALETALEAVGTSVDTLMAATADYDTRTAVQLAQVDSTANLIRTGGYATAGDGGHALYKRVASMPSHQARIQSGDGAWWEYVPEPAGAKPEALGAINAGAADDATAVQNWLDYVVDSGIRRGIARGTYRLDSTVTISDPHAVHIDANGSLWKTPNDILLIDVNGRADPTYTDNESRQFFVWDGGHFLCEVATPTKATAFRMFGMRDARLTPKQFGLELASGNAQGWYRDIQLAGKDTVLVEKYKTFDVEKASIEVAPWSMIGANIRYTFRDIHASIANGGSLVYSYAGLTDSTIYGCSANMGTGATHVAIEVARCLNIGVASVSNGPFQVGETVTGGTSSATAVVVEQYLHDFDFDVAAANSHKTWLVLETRSGTFQTGETLTGGTSSATASVGSDAGYLAQNSNWTGFSIDGDMHFESGSGAGTGCTGIYLRNRESTGNGAVNMYVNAGSCGTNSTGGVSYGVRLQKIQKTTIEGRFSHTGSNVPIQFDADCAEVKVAKTSTFAAGAIDLNSMDRYELDLSEFNTPHDSPLQGVASTTISGTQGTTSSAVAADAKATVGGLYPKSYDVIMQLRDSDLQNTTGSTRARIFEAGETSQSRKWNLQIGNIGGVSNELYDKFVTVKADPADGEFDWDGVENSAGTVTFECLVIKSNY